MPLSILALIALITFAASIIQGMVGFGFGMITIPLFLAAGLDLPESIILATATSMAHTGLATYELRAHLNWKNLKPAIIWRSIGLPIGILALGYIDHNWPIEQTKQLVGVSTLVVIALQISKARARGISSNPLSAIGAFFLSGFMAGSIGMGGPPMVLWVTSQNWRVQSAKAFIIASIACSLPLNLIFLYLKFPDKFNQVLLPAAWSLIAVIIGLRLGLKVSQLWSEERLKKGIYIVLGLIAFKLVINI